MHLPPNAVSADLLHDADTFVTSKLLDGRADVPETSAITNDRDAHVAATTRDIDDALRIRAHFADQEHRTGVTVVAVDVGGDINVDDVAHLEQLAGAGDAVAHHVVSAGADSSREAAIPELTGAPSSTCRVLANEPVNLRRRHARPKPRANERQRLCGQPTGASHALDLGEAEDLDRHRCIVT